MRRTQTRQTALMPGLKIRHRKIIRMYVYEFSDTEYTRAHIMTYDQYSFNIIGGINHEK